MFDIHLGAGLLLTARVCVGLFFLASAIGKLANRHRFIEGTVDYQILPEPVARFAASILPWIELLIAVALLVGLALPVAGLAAAALLVSFMGAVGINLKRGRVIPCHCYGIAGTPTIGLGTIIRNALLLALALTVFGLGVSLSRFDDWLNPWPAAWTALSSATNAVLVSMLLLWSLVLVQLVEWAVDMHIRIADLGQPPLARNSTEPEHSSRLGLAS
jgi:Methylamine utilisation protein MauE